MVLVLTWNIAAAAAVAKHRCHCRVMHMFDSIYKRGEVYAVDVSKHIW